VVAEASVVVSPVRKAVMVAPGTPVAPSSVISVTVPETLTVPAAVVGSAVPLQSYGPMVFVGDIVLFEPLQAARAAATANNQKARRS
jgi:hypothetical protein